MYTYHDIKCRTKIRWTDALTGNTVGIYEKKKVYVPVPDAFVAKFGKRITCEGYRGYGIFGDYDIFELVAEWNHAQIREILELIRTDQWNYPCTSEDVKNLQGAYKGNTPITCNRRTIGKILSYYTKDNERLLYPIKVTYDANVSYEELGPSSVLVSGRPDQV